MKKLFLLSTILVLAAACVTDEIENQSTSSKQKDLSTETFDGGFDFTTFENVELTVDYSRCNPKSAIFFSVYSENPFNGEDFKEGLSPIYEGYTDKTGKFSELVQLPAYADQLYIFTGNFFIDEELMTAQVSNNMAQAVATGEAAAAPRSLRASRRAGAQTDDLSTLYQLSYLVDWRTGDNTGERIYKDWNPWLGTWDSMSGAPSYLLKSTDPNYSQFTFTEDEMKGIYQAISGALEDHKACDMSYRQAGDLLLTQESEVAVTLVGVNTCWNSSIGYYYYMEGQEPKSLQDLNVVMLFPNAQDGKSIFMKRKGNEYYGNIALNRGDVVKLKYYPNIASGSKEGARDAFPAGMKIGFLLKSNGWGMQKSVEQADGTTKNYYNSYLGEIKGATISRQYNVWGASTDGLSYCKYDADQNRIDGGSLTKTNPNGLARTAKFAFETAEGKQCAIVSFEDACNDDDFDDIILAMKPVGVFRPLPSVKPRTTITKGVYAFEDLWPSKGDYDMNDALVDYKESRELSVLEMGGDYMITKQTFSLTTYLNYVTKTSGLALTLNTPVTPSSIVMKKVSPTGTEEEVTFTKDGKVYLLTDNIRDEENTTYILELNYNTGIKVAKAATVKPFIYRDEANDKRWEVHIPYEAPTAKMNYDYFGTNDDSSVPADDKFFIRRGNYPFAFFLSGISIDSFKNTLLERTNEKTPISDLYPDFLEWSTSGGASKKDWYKHPGTSN